MKSPLNSSQMLLCMLMYVMYTRTDFLSKQITFHYAAVCVCLKFCNTFLAKYNNREHFSSRLIFESKPKGYFTVTCIQQLRPTTACRGNFRVIYHPTCRVTNLWLPTVACSKICMLYPEICSFFMKTY